MQNPWNICDLALFKSLWFHPGGMCGLSTLLISSQLYFKTPWHKLRQEADGNTPLKGKAIGISFPIDWNSKPISGQLNEEARPWPDHIFLVLDIRRPLWAHIHSKGPLEAKGELCQGVFYPDPFLLKYILAKRCVYTHERILRYIKYGLWSRQIKRLAKGNQESPIKIIQTATWAWLKDAPSESAPGSIHMYCTLFPPNKYSAWFATFHFYGNFLLQSWRARALVTDH